jgi:hypothetical protein
MSSPTHISIAHRGRPWTGLKQDIQGIHVHMIQMTHYLLV